MAQTKVLKKGFYELNDLNLTPNAAHTIQNNSLNEYAFIIIFDSNQIVQQLIRLEPKSEAYHLVPILPEYELIVVGNGEVTIS